MQPILFESCLLDLNAVEQGRWCRHPRGFSWLLASARREAFTQRRDALREPHRALLAAAPQTKEAQRIIDETFLRALADTIVLDWRDMNRRAEDGSGRIEPIPFSADAVYAILSNPAAVHIRDWVSIQASNDERCMALAEASDAGNSVPGSGGG